MSRSRVLLVSLLLLVSLAAWLPGAAADPDHDHPDVGWSPSFALFPTHTDVQTGLQAHADHPWVTLHALGNSSDGRPILLAEVIDPESMVPLEERAVTFLFTQQHGNEPAGTPAALKLLDDIAAGAPIAKTLSNQVLLLLPMANPDGATTNQRANAQGTDINRDHITLETPESNLLHTVLNRWDVHVAMDHHEYGGTGLGNPSPVRVYDYDLTTLFPVHGNVREPTRQAAVDLMYEGIWPRAEADGFTANEYGEQTVAGIPVEQVAGGPDPGIMRNHMGLHHIAGLLVETRIDAHPNPFHDAARRTAIHTSVMEATLEYVHDNAATFRDAKAKALQEDQDAPWRQYLEGTSSTMAAAYLVPADAPTPQLFDRHMLPAGHKTMDGIVHNIANTEYAGHAAAIIHPDSSRGVVDGVATNVVVPETVEPQKVVAESPAPILSLVALAALSALAAGVLRRR